jgi:hypothetical protein
MLEIVTASSDPQYTTTAAVKALLGTTETSDDSLINSMITVASRWADNYVGYPLSAAGYRETLSGFGGRRMILSRRPVRSVDSLWSATDTGTATTYLTSEFKVDRDDGFLERDEGFAWDAPGVPRPFSVPLGVAYWAGEEESPWLADYTAGYTYSGVTTDSDIWSTEHGTTSTGRTLPEDIEHAVLMKAAELYEDEGDIVERSVGDLRLKYATNRSGMPTKSPAETLLDQYRSYI